MDFRPFRMDGLPDSFFLYVTTEILIFGDNTKYQYNQDRWFVGGWDPTHKRNITILTNSRLFIKVSELAVKLVSQCRDKSNSLCGLLKGSLFWAPGYRNIRENELARRSWLLAIGRTLSAISCTNEGIYSRYLSVDDSR